MICKQTPETFYVLVWEGIRGVFNAPFQVLGQLSILLWKNVPRKTKTIFKDACKTKDYDKESRSRIKDKGLRQRKTQNKRRTGAPNGLFRCMSIREASITLLGFVVKEICRNGGNITPFFFEGANIR